MLRPIALSTGGLLIKVKLFLCSLKGSRSELWLRSPGDTGEGSDRARGIGATHWGRSEHW